MKWQGSQLVSDPSTESRPFPWVYIILGAVLLLPSLAFPIYTDHATFLRGGAAIFDGELLYVDFIDVKPPLAFVVFGIFEFFIGSSEVGMRVLDLIWQTSTIAVMLMVFRRYDISRKAQFAFSVLYAISYVTLHWAQSLQMETLAGLPIAVILLMLSKPKALWRNVVIGFCLAMIVLMKYTLGIVAVMLVAHMLVTPAPTKEKVTQIAQWTVFSLVWVLVFLAPFVFRDGFLEGWQAVSAYTANYASNPAWSIDLVRAALKKTATLFGDNLSLFVCIAAVIGASRGILFKDDRTSSFTTLLVFLTIGLLATVILERKFAPYHFSRIYLMMSVLAGMGIAYGNREDQRDSLG